MLVSVSGAFVPRGDGLSGLEDAWLLLSELRHSILLVSQLDETKASSILTLLHQS
jgi:hypothetical protein